MKKLLMCGAAALMMMGVASAAEAAKLRFGSGEVCTQYGGRADSLVGKFADGQHLYVRWIGENYGVGEDGLGYEAVEVYPVDNDGSLQRQFEVLPTSDTDDNGWYHFVVPYTGTFALVDIQRSQGAMDGYRVDVCAFTYEVGLPELPEE